MRSALEWLVLKDGQVFLIAAPEMELVSENAPVLVTLRFHPWTNAGWQQRRRRIERMASMGVSDRVCGGVGWSGPEFLPIDKFTAKRLHLNKCPAYGKA